MRLLQRRDKMNYLKKQRKRCGLKQRELAIELKIDRSTVSKWETAGNKPCINKLAALAKVLRITKDDIIKNCY